MPNPVYFDSALIAKFYLNEPGRQAVRKLAQQAERVVTSAIAIAEVSAAFHRNGREGSMSLKGVASLQGQFDYDTRSGLWTMRPVSEAMLENVAKLFAKLPATVYLRALDALHIVTVKSERLDRIYTNDRHMLAACAHAGIEGVNPLV
jgi:predicted nucleic acid-binding protein